MFDQYATKMAERGYVPDLLLRQGIRRILRDRLQSINHGDIESANQLTQKMVNAMQAADIAVLTDKANEQHYEVPANYFRYCLGEKMKYSCGFWRDDAANLDTSELDAINITCQRAQLDNGLNILELGCGWGSLTLHMASSFPDSNISAVTNSTSQAEYIRDKASSLGLANITVFVENMTSFQPQQQFDRVVSVEMFEHMRNWPTLFARVADWLNAEGKFFMHVFCHKNTPYFFEDEGENDWMSRTFFSGGLMPSSSLPLRFQADLSIESQWAWNGKHYAKTANAWLSKMDANKSKIMPLFEECYGSEQALIWWNRWRMFHTACAELFAYRDGQEWMVGHYLFQKKPATSVLAHAS